MVVTIAAVGAFLALRAVPLPELDPVARAALGPDSALGVGALGVVPFVTGAWFVAAASWFFRRWGWVRDAGAEDGALVAVTRASVVVAAIQGLLLVTTIESFRGPDGRSVIVEHAWQPRLVMTVSVVAGTVACRLLAEVIQRWGVGSGVGILLVCGTGWRPVMRLLAAAPWVGHPETALPSLLFVIAAPWLGAKLLGGEAPSPRAPGAVLAGWGQWGTVSALSALFGATGQLLAGVPVAPAGWLVALAAGVLMTALWGAALNQPALVGAVYGRYGRDPEAVAGELRAAINPALGLTMALTVAMGLTEEFGARAPIPAGLLGLVTWLGITGGLVAEAVRERKRLGDGALTRVWVVQRPYEAHAALEFLSAREVTAHARGLAYRRAGPLDLSVPIEIVVPQAQADVAREALRGVRAPVC